MGWLFSHQSRHQLIRALIAYEETDRARIEVLAHSLRGNVLWSVVHVIAKQEGVLKLPAGGSTSYIGCTLLQRADSRWGYKSLDESMHPYYYSCPLRYLDMAPVQCREWRERVLRYHQIRRERRALLAA
jgi:hypothetical protein